MPSGYAHYRFAAQMLPRLPENVKAKAQKFRDLYDLGSHGPDVFFFYRPVVNNSVVNLGKKLHFRPGKELFASAARRLRLQPREEGEAYLYGLLTHYALDSLCHPYVKQAQEEGIAEHIEMETEFDRLLLEQDGLLLPKPRFSTRHMRLPREESRIVAAFYPGVTPRQLQEAAFTMGALSRSFWHKPGMTYRVAKKALGHKFSQFLMTPQENPRCRVTNEKLLALYGRAQARFDALCRGIGQHMASGVPLGPEFDLAFDLSF